jgi:hypothetical protein
MSYASSQKAPTEAYSEINENDEWTAIQKFNTLLHFEEQKQAMEIMKEQYEKQGESLMNMSRMNAQIEKEKAEYLAIFSRHNLDLLATKKPGLIESRFNNASEAVMEGLEDDTEALYSIDNPTTND